MGQPGRPRNAAELHPAPQVAHCRLPLHDHLHDALRVLGAGSRNREPRRGVPQRARLGFDAR